MVVYLKIIIYWNIFTCTVLDDLCLAWRPKPKLSILSKNNNSSVEIRFFNRLSNLNNQKDETMFLYGYSLSLYIYIYFHSTNLANIVGFPFCHPALHILKPVLRLCLRNFRTSYGCKTLLSTFDNYGWEILLTWESIFTKKH